MIVRIKRGLYKGGKEAFLDINRGCLITLQSFLRGKGEGMMSTSIDVYILPIIMANSYLILIIYS